MGSCGRCYKCGKPLMAFEKSWIIGNPILLCKKCNKELIDLNHKLKPYEDQLSKSLKELLKFKIKGV